MMENVYDLIDKLAPAYVQFWKEISEMETPSTDKAALDALADKLEAHARAIGCGVLREKFEQAGDCLRLDLPGECLKLISATIVALAIGLPALRSGRTNKKGGKTDAQAA